MPGNCISLERLFQVSLIWLAFLVLPSPMLAQSAGPTVVRDFYSTPGLNPFEERINENFNESISPFNGILQITNTDIYLPGNGGMDLRVIRRYQSSVEDRSVKQVYGYGWDISYGELRFVTANVLNASTCTTAAGLFDTKDNPVFITPEGSSELLVDNDASMAAATDAILVSKGRFKLGCEPAEFPATENVWVVYSPDGIRYELGYQSPVADINGRFQLYVTRISDSNDNSIEIDYEINSNFVVYITSVYDSSDGRTVNFSYTDANTNNIRLESIISGSQLWRYKYQSIYDYNNATGALDGFLSYPDFDNYHLLRVVRPDGRDWEYAYYTEELVPGENNIYQKRRHLLKETTYPYGGNIEYEYQDVFFGEASAFYALPHQVIKTKKVNVIADDRVSNMGSLSSDGDNVWTYSFFPGQGGLTGNTGQFGDLTVVQTPASTDTYLHYGYDHTVEGDIWKIGLLVSKSVKNERDEALYIERNTWAPQAISTEAYWNGRGSEFRDSETRAPLLIKKEILQHGLLYTTDFSKHDNFGNPINIVRGGSSVSDTIDTEYSYLIDTNLWIVSQSQDETTVDVGTITRSYDAKGNLEQQSRFGVVTNFTYTPEGDLETETDANNQVTTSSDYYRGIPRRIEFPENKIITRTVNSTGTVESETNARGFVTNYDYDVMDRLISIDYPAHADVSIDYATNNRRLVRTLTRGGFREVTRFSSLMNPIQIEKTDLATGTEITTVNEFDILGRQTFVSKPTYGSYPVNLNQSQRDQFGVTTILDALGRELEVRNPDGTQRFTAYSNEGGNTSQAETGSVRITDERGNITINRFIGYGSPGDNRLVRIEAPEDMTTTANYGKLRNITRIWQGEQGGSGHQRLYNFDSRFFLQSEDHPETGHVVFGRDAVGNMISRQVKNSDISGSTLPDSGVTSYFYDGLNRLEEVDYPGTTPDVFYTYDAEDNIKTVSNTNSNRAYVYDQNNNLINEDITIDEENYSLSYGYNNLDYLDTVTYPSGRSVIYENDAFGRPKGIVNYVDQVTYFPGGQKETVLYANGISTTFAINNREWVNSIKVNSDGQNGLVDLTYLYDGRGNVEQIIDGLDINTRLMTYDGVDRLKTANGMWGAGSFDYDHEDNMVNRTIGSTVDEYVVSNNKMLQLKRNGLAYITPLYDVYGNQLNTATRDLVFDDASNLRSAKIPFGDLATDVKFDYDGNNRRVSRRVGQISPDITHYVYSKGDVVFAEINFIDDSTRENIFLGSQMVASNKIDKSDPVAQISLQAAALERMVVSLDGTGSFDPDGSIVSYSWVQKSGTPVSIIDLGNGLAEFETPIVAFDESLVFELRVTDNDGNFGISVAGINIRQTDIDNDAISDLWEAIYFPGNLSQLGGAGSDFDNDGFSDLEEFHNSTEPIIFDRLDAPTGILVTTGISSVDLAWPAVGRTNRYVIYYSTTPVVPLTDSNRTYTSSSPFVQEDLNNGQFIYYVIVAERLDINGNFLGDSDPSEVIRVKVGWRTWPQRIIHSTQDSRVEGGNEWLKINENGDTEVTWKTYIDGVGQPLTYRNYTQQGGWSVATNTNPSPDPDPYSGPPVRVVENADGISAEYYDEATGWGESEQILADPLNEYFLADEAFDNSNEGIVLVSRVVGQFPSFTIEQYYLFYAPATGWTSLQLIPITPVSGSFTVWLLNLGGDGVGQLIYEDNGINSISFSPSTGWGSTTPLGISVITSVATDSSGHINILSKVPDAIPGYFTLESVHYTPGQGWSAVQAIESTAAEYETGIEFVAIDPGRAFVVYYERFAASFKIREYIPGNGWQSAEARQISSCDYDDYPSDIDEIYSSGNIPTVQSLPSDPDVFFNIKTNQQGVISIITKVFGSNRTNMLFASRYEPQAGWLQDEVLHCPWASWGPYSIRAVSQAMNSAGTTFVFWTYNDDGEIQGDLKLLSNKFEMLKGEPPIAEAGLDQAVTEGDEVTLDASLSSDVDNEIVAYQWDQISGISVNVANHGMALATFIAPLVGADEALSFELTVIDESGNQAFDSVDITVTNFSTTELGVVLASSSTGPLTVGDSLTLNAQAAGGTSGAYEYQFRYKSFANKSDPWVILKDFDAVDNVSWSTANLAGKYRLQARAREFGNESLIVKDSTTIWVNSNDPLSSVFLSSSAIGPQPEGLPINLSALVGDAVGAIEYRFELKNTDIQPGWILLSDYGVSENLAWNSNGYLGKNKIRVYARRAGTLDLAVRDTVTVWINPIDAVTSVLLLPSLFSPQSSGAEVTFNTSITGGNGSVEYRYSVKDTEDLAEWVVQQDWSAMRTFAWDTTDNFGKQRVRVEARNAGSPDREVNDKMPYWLNDGNPLTSVDLQVDQPGLIVVGPTINFSAVPGGTTNLYEYQFRVKGAAPTASWTVLRDFDSDPGFQVSSASYIGKNKFQVRARNQGTLDKEVKNSKSIWVNSLNAITDITLSGSDSSVTWGESITFTMSFTGGDGSFYFSRELKNPGEGFMGNDYFRQSSTNSFEFDVGGMMPGTYRMRVRAINAETDKPVKSNSVKFTVSENLDLSWQIGGENYNSIQECTIYECPCAVIGGCYSGGADTGVFGGGY